MDRSRQSRSEATEERVLDSIARGRRENLTPRQAARSTHTTLGTIQRHGAGALERRGRRWAFTAFDTIPRAMNVLTPNGPVAVTVRDSRIASLLGEHANAVKWYVETGQTDRLDELGVTRVVIGGVRYELAIDPDVLDRLAEGSELEFDPYRFR